MLTVGSLVAVRELGLSVLVTGPPEALEAKLSWVHTTELPDPSGYIGRSELVMTNGLWMPKVPPAAFVEACCAAGASGIVFGLLETTPETPPTLIDACRKANLLLLQLPIEVPFAAVTHAAANVLADDRRSPLITTLRRAETFADTLAAEHGAQGVLRVLRREHPDLPLALVDRTGALLAQAGTSLTASDRTVTITALARKPPPLELVLEAGTATLLPVGAFGQPEAALLCLRHAAHLSEAQQGALSQAAHFLVLDIARRQAVRASEERFAHELIDMIVSGTGSTPDIARRLAAFGLSAGEPLVVLAASSRGDTTMSKLAAVMGATLSERGIPAMVATGPQDVVVVLAWRQPADALIDWCHGLAADLSAYSPTLAAADPVHSAGNLRTALLEARRTSQVLGRTGHGFTVARLADLPTYHTVLSNIEPQLLQHLSSILTPLREYDANHTDGALENTLRNLIEYQGHYKRTAQALHLHVNGLYGRLARISSLTGRDPRTLEGRLDLLLALEADALLTL
ncbi:PucR family transcriptional regulator ligand-binding domain-containing protein [Streptomyces sp. ME01-18a]|uniref:PucR family transcriptional regulator n=1 Tax=Streptomyces sp. ME01-18a TaxID=3028669 RepID=UPI0029AD57C0|nr:PucR family transcriptional regulator ligand-binding domain-containing protein [Streptomyces sp. ME01-18a]MDX3434327.1 PucR family transcriptional regulator ligand-binding domain-containing protein [Streptomyces sp. ME01-18a]